MKYTNEDQLLRDFHDGNEKAFEFIFHRYYKRLCLFCSSFVDESKEAEDITEDGFIRFWQAKPKVENLQHLKASLYQTVRRLGINHQIARTRRQAHTMNYSAEQTAFQESQLEEIVYAETMGELYQAIHALPPKAQEIIKLSYLEGLTNQEVADQLFISLQTVKNQKQRALVLLRKTLNKETFRFLLIGAFILKNIGKF
jgi:RNA polymerase sigma factor, sigma-70 family